MITKIIDGIFSGFAQLLPKSDEPTIQWIAKLCTLTAIGAFVFVGSFMILQDTDLADEWGIDIDRPAMISNIEYRNINARIYVELVRAKEAVPPFRAILFLAVFDKNGNINFANRSFKEVGIFSWFIQNGTYISFPTLEEVIMREMRPYFDDLAFNKDCVAGEINEIGKERYRQAVPAFISDRFVMCPVPNQKNPNLPFGGVIAFYVDNPERSNLQQESLVTIEDLSKNIGTYLQNIPDLPLNQK